MIHKIENVRTYKEKPEEDIKILNIDIVCIQLVTLVHVSAVHMTLAKKSLPCHLPHMTCHKISHF